MTSSSAHSRASRAWPAAVSPGAAGRRSPPSAGHGVDQRAGGGADLDRVELEQVARQRGLGDADALLGEQRGELALRAHLVVGDQLDDLLVPGVLGAPGAARCHGSVMRCSIRKASSAFWACRRFSASSQTTLCGPSMTSAAISLPR